MTSQLPVELDQTCGCSTWWHFLTQLTNPLQNSVSSLQGSSVHKAAFPEQVGTTPKRKLTRGHTGTHQSWVCCRLLRSVVVSLHFLLSRWVLLFYKEKWRQATAINHNSRQVSWLRNSWSTASLWRQNISQTPLHPFIISVGVLLWPLLPQNSGAPQIYWLPATFFFRELAIKVNRINKGSLVPLHLDKSRHFGKCLWGRITVWESRSFR